jgi:hypothetical protein
MDARSEPTRRGLSQRIGVLVDGFETVIYAIAAAIFMIRYSSRRAAPTHAEDG